MPFEQLVDYIARHYDSRYLVVKAEKYDAKTWNMAMRKALCKIKGHDYPAAVFGSGCLHFCRRCGEEILGRTFEDLEPVRVEEIEEALAGGMFD